MFLSGLAAPALFLKKMDILIDFIIGLSMALIILGSIVFFGTIQNKNAEEPVKNADDDMLS